MRNKTLGAMTAINDSGSIIAVYKPKGMTSFEVVRNVRTELRLRKVGHAGTLDPLAEGLLILLTGKKTKMMDHFLKLDKEYIATLRLGVVSKSHDLETELIEHSGELPTLERIREVVSKFTGTIEQVPPNYSATWVEGKRAYDLARRGVEFELKPKTVKISRIDVEAYSPPLLSLRVVCSSGTYIRSLARDIGDEIGCGSVLEGLLRTRIGTYKVQDAIKLDELKMSFAA